MIVRCWPRLACAATSRAGELHPQVVALWTDQRDAVPQLLLADLPDPAPERVRQLAEVALGAAGPGLLQVVVVAQANRRSPLVGRGDRIVQRTDPGVELRDHGHACGGHPRAHLRQLLIPEHEGLLACLLGPDGAQQRVALGKDPGQLREVPRPTAITLRQDRVQEAPTLGRSAHQQEHLLGPEQDGARRLAHRRAAPRDAVDGEALADLGRRGLPGNDQLDASRLPGIGPAQVEPHTAEIGPVADQLGVAVGTMATSRDRHEDRFQQIRLAGTVGSRNDRQAGVEMELRRGIAAVVLERQVIQAHDGLRMRCGPA